VSAPGRAIAPTYRSMSSAVNVPARTGSLRKAGAQEGEVACADNLLRQPRDLKKEHVRAPQQLPRAQKPVQEAGRVGDVEDREPPDTPRVAHRRDPGNYSAPIVTDHDSRPFSAGQDQALHIAR
jgi:hypothetical protein